MATPIVFLTEEDRQLLSDLLRRERGIARRLGKDTGTAEAQEKGTLNAVTKASTPIPADAVALVTICELDWTPIDGYELEAHNPSQVEVPGDGTRLILQPGKGKDNSCQIQNAFLCEP